MKCICGEKTRIIKMKIGDKTIGFLICCPSLKKCGLNSNWQPTNEDAKREFKKAVHYRNRDKTGKRCKTCGKIKNVSEFYQNFHCRDGYFNVCKKCHLEACKKNQMKKRMRGIA